MFDNTPKPPLRHFRSQFEPSRYYCGASHDVHGRTKSTEEEKQVTCPQCLARLNPKGAAHGA
jgi:hypothetical protein